jgi:galactose mutarotase-like enzyme
MKFVVVHDREFFDALSKTGLDISIEVTNTGEEILPASIGLHPTFNWPLQGGVRPYILQRGARADPSVERRPLAASAGVNSNCWESPGLIGRLFDDDAVILDQLASRSVRYAADHGPSVEVSWHDFRELGIWSKVGGAALLCIEPWYGFASPADFDGECNDKPGLMRIAPAATRSLNCHIRIE